MLRRSDWETAHRYRSRAPAEKKLYLSCLAIVMWWRLPLLLQCNSERIHATANSPTFTPALASAQTAASSGQVQSRENSTRPSLADSASATTWKSKHLLRDSRPSEEQKRKHRVVLSYELRGCPSDVKGAEDEEQLLQGQEASNQTMKLLRDKLSKIVSSKKFKQTEAVSPSSELFGYSQSSRSTRVTTELSSRYLSSLQMEVIKTLPPEVSEAEVIDIAESLPCVVRAYPDGLKYPDEVFPGSMEIQTPTPLQKGDLTPGLDQDLLSVFVLRKDVDLSHQNGGGVPSDPGFVLQWNLHDSPPFSVHAERLWRIWTGEKRPMVIAVIDSGCDLEHPDLKSRVWNNPGEICDDGIDNDQNGFVDDCHGWNFADDSPNVSASANGHGTGAAGILGAAAGNHLGLVGVCWGCEIMCLKFIGTGNGAISDQVQAIDYAVKVGAWISNNSYGGYGFSELEFDAIRRAQIGGHLFVTSAGNLNLNTDLPLNDHTPSTYDLSNILSVGASTYYGKKAAFSNYGVQTVHVFAPGADVYTTEGVAGYAKVNGTSFASPHVAGAAGLIWSAFPGLTYMQVKEALMRGCTQSSQLEPLAACGGTVDVVTSFRIAAELAAGIVAASPDEGSMSLSLSSKTLTTKEEQPFKTRALPAREPETSSIPGIDEGIASSKRMDAKTGFPLEPLNPPAVSKHFAADSSLGPAISIYTYKNDEMDDTVQSSSLKAARTSSVVRSCAGALERLEGEGPEVRADCGFLSRLPLVLHDVSSKSGGTAVNDTALVESAPLSFSLFNDKRLQQALRAKTKS